MKIKNYTDQDIKNLEGEKLEAEIRTLNMRWWRSAATLTTIVSVMIAAGALVVSWSDAREAAKKAELEKEKAENEKTKFENQQWDIKRQTADLTVTKNDLLRDGKKLGEENAELAKKKDEYEDRVRRIGEAIRAKGSIKDLLASGPAATLLLDVLYPVPFVELNPPGWGKAKGVSATASLNKDGKLAFKWIIDAKAIQEATFKAPRCLIEITPLSKDKPKITQMLPVPQQLKFQTVVDHERRTRSHGSPDKGRYEEVYYEDVVRGYYAIATDTDAIIDYGPGIVPEVVVSSQLRIVLAETPK